MKLGCIADDFTGATDLANELAAQGLHTEQLIGLPAGGAASDAEAVVIALKSRSIDPDEAVAQSVEAAQWLLKAGAPRLYFKYCSTFDSTARGNIGPVLEALAALAGEKAVIACPAFPATGRTVFQGHLFVGNRLLSESGMENHPLNPMRDSDLVRVLGAQMRGRVALLPCADIRSGQLDARMQAFEAGDIAAVIADATDDAELSELGGYCAGRRLSSGGSGLGAGLARALVPPGAARASVAMPAGAGRRAILAGSCSIATQAQVAMARQRYPSLRITLTSPAGLEEVLAQSCRWIDAQDSGLPLLVYSTSSPEEVERQRQSFGANLSSAIEDMLGRIALHLVETGVDSLLVAGGETSGAVVGSLGVERLEIGPEIDPGVPWTIARRAAGPPLRLALKSGNFGSEDFLIKAWEHLA